MHEDTMLPTGNTCDRACLGIRLFAGNLTGISLDMSNKVWNHRAWRKAGTINSAMQSSDCICVNILGNSVCGGYANAHVPPQCVARAYTLYVRPSGTCETTLFRCDQIYPMFPHDGCQLMKDFRAKLLCWQNDNAGTNWLFLEYPRWHSETREWTLYGLWCIPELTSITFWSVDKDFCAPCNSSVCKPLLCGCLIKTDWHCFWTIASKHPSCSILCGGDGDVWVDAAVNLLLRSIDCSTKEDLVWQDLKYRLKPILHNDMVSYANYRYYYV